MSTGRSTEQRLRHGRNGIEDEMTLKPVSMTALRGVGAAAFGRDLRERAAGNRSPLDPSAVAG